MENLEILQNLINEDSTEEQRASVEDDSVANNSDSTGLEYFQCVSHEKSTKCKKQANNLYSRTEKGFTCLNRDSSSTSATVHIFDVFDEKRENGSPLSNEEIEMLENDGINTVTVVNRANSSNVTLSITKQPKTSELIQTDTRNEIKDCKKSYVIYILLLIVVIFIVVCLVWYLYSSYSRCNTSCATDDKNIFSSWNSRSMRNCEGVVW